MVQKVFFKLKERFMGMKLYNMIACIASAIMLVVILIMGIVLHIGKNSLPDQLMAKRWSEKEDVAQISCFYAADANMTEQSIVEMQYNLEKKLQEHQKLK